MRPLNLSDPKDPQRSRVRAVVAGFGTPAAIKTVSLVVNGKTIATHKVEVPANGRATVEFAPLDVSYGFNRCEVRIDGSDALPADDASVFAVRRSDPERVLLVHSASDSRSAIYFGAALKAAAKSSFVLQSVAQEQTTDFDPSQFAFVVLSDSIALPAIFEHALAQYVAKGGSVFIALGTNAAHHARIPVWDGNVTDAHDYARTGGRGDRRPGRLRASGAARPHSRDATTAAGLKPRCFMRRSSIRAGARVAARLSDGTPLVLDKQIGPGAFAVAYDRDSKI